MPLPGPDQLGVLIPIVALLIPIVRTLSNHQLKMAELLHSNRADGRLEAQVAALQAEVSSLRDVVNNQTIALDNLNRSRVDVNRIEDRLTDRI